MGYSSCGIRATCNCAFYLKKAKSALFIDFCSATSPLSPTSKAYGLIIDKNATEFNIIKEISQLCPWIPLKYEDDAKTWDNIKPIFGNFKCAKLQGRNHYDDFVVKIWN